MTCLRIMKVKNSLKAELNRQYNENSNMNTEPARIWKPHPAYKHSGVEWLGEVPEHWEVKRVKSFTAMHKQGYYTEQAYIDDGVKLARITDIDDFGNVFFKNMPFVAISPNDERSFELKDGDFLFARSGTIGRFGLVRNPERSVFASYLILFRFKGVEKEFLRYAFGSHFFEESLISTLHGGANQNVHAENIKEQSLAVPPLPEQRAIASFLDRQTAHLDALISKKERLIALLEEKRAALISSAVTKGLEPNVPMKDSGVEWLGKVPERWEVKRLKYIAPLSNNKLTEKPDELLYLGLEQVESKTGRLLLDVMVENVESIVSVFKKRDVLFGKLRPYLAKVVYTEFNGVCTSELLVLKPNSTSDGKFLFYRLISDDFINLVDSMTYGTKMPRASSEQIANVSIPLPAVSEQRAIASFLECETAKIAALIAKIRDGIVKMREYRTALISSAVTGKIDVREVV